MLQNGSELKSAEVNNLKFKVTLDLFASKEEGKSDKTAYTQLLMHHFSAIKSLFTKLLPNTFKGRFAFACPDTMDTSMKRFKRRNNFNVNFY